VNVNNLLKRWIKEDYTGLATQNFFDEVVKKKYDIDYDNKIIIYNDNKISYKTHFNTQESCDTAKDKIKTSTILSDNDIPVPKFIEIDLSNSVNDITKMIADHTIHYPVVLKPIRGTFGIDVVTDIDNVKELSLNISNLKKKYKEVILEEQVEGDCYRIFVFNNKVIDVIKREKPFIIGDGEKTINNLIKIRNKEQIDMKLPETKNLSNLFIKKQGYNLTDVPDRGVKVYISNVINMHNGARIFRIPLSSIPDQNIDLFIRVNKAMNIYCSGLDYMSKDITIPYYINNSYILEVNGTPDTEIHTKIDGFNFFENLVDSIF